MGSAALFTQLMDSEGCPYGREIIADISMQLRRECASAGLTIMQEGQFGNSMYFIKDGEVEVYKIFSKSNSLRGRRWAQGEEEYNNRTLKLVADNDTDIWPRSDGSISNLDDEKGERLGRLGPRGFFGETAVMHVGRMRNDTGATRSLRTRTAVAKTSCELLQLKKDDLDELREQYDALDQSMRNIENALANDSSGLSAAQMGAAAGGATDADAILANMTEVQLARAVKKLGYNLVKEVIPAD